MSRGTERPSFPAGRPGGRARRGRAARARRGPARALGRRLAARAGVAGALAGRRRARPGGARRGRLAGRARGPHRLRLCAGLARLLVAPAGARGARAPGRPARRRRGGGPRGRARGRGPSPPGTPGRAPRPARAAGRIGLTRTARASGDEPPELAAGRCHSDAPDLEEAVHRTAADPAPTRRRLMSSIACLAVAAAAALWAPATGAAHVASSSVAADALARVRSLGPGLEGARARVLGGDQRIWLKVDPSRPIIVLGYVDEPF